MPRTDRPSDQLMSRLDRRSFLRLASLAGLGATGVGTLAACGSSSSSSGSDSSSSGSGSAAKDLGTIGIQLSWIKNIEFAGEYFADSKGYYKDAGFSTVNLIAGGASASSAEAAVASGKAFAGLSSPIATAAAILKGADLITVATTYQKNPFCIVSKKGSGITSPQAMLGKKIGVQSGTNSTIFDALCKANSIDKSKITIVPVQFDPTVVATGEVDGFMAYITNEPILLAAKGTQVDTFLFADHGLPLANETIVVSGKTAREEKAKLKAFLTAEVKGWIDALNDPEGGAKLAVDTYGKDAKLDLQEQIQEINAQAQLIVTADTQKNGIFTMTDDFIDQNIKSLSNAGVDITAKKLFDLSVLKTVYSSNPDLVSKPTLSPSAAPSS